MLFQQQGTAVRWRWPNSLSSSSSSSVSSFVLKSSFLFRVPAGLLSVPSHFFNGCKFPGRLRCPSFVLHFRMLIHVWYGNTWLQMYMRTALITIARVIRHYVNIGTGDDAVKRSSLNYHALLVCMDWLIIPSTSKNLIFMPITRTTCTYVVRIL